MQETFENPELPHNKPKLSPLTVGMGLVVAVAILLSLWFLFEPLQSHKSNSVQESIVIKMSPFEQEYSKKIEVGKLAMSRAENFLHQEVTTLTGELYNGGTEPVLGLALTTEFVDDMNQIVLRESRMVLGSPAAPLAPGERRAFEISFDHVPNSWNMQTPAVRISHLQLPARKQ
jgi:hypothetical protein